MASKADSAQEEKTVGAAAAAAAVPADAAAAKTFSTASPAPRGDGRSCCDEAPGTVWGGGREKAARMVDIGTDRSIGLRAEGRPAEGAERSLDEVSRKHTQR